jgi:hypothetical protein
MVTWLPVVVLAAAQVTLRLISIAAMVWRERARANSHCAQMRTASASGVVLLEWRQEGDSLAIVPQARKSHDNDAGSADLGPGGTPVA